MKAETLFEAMGDVQEQYIKEAAFAENVSVIPEEETRQPGKRRYAFACVAACAVLLIAAVVAPGVFRLQHRKPPMSEGNIAKPDSTGEDGNSELPDSMGKPGDSELPGSSGQPDGTILFPEFIGAAGGMGYLAYSPEELVDTNPWREDLTPETLPVFRNPIAYSGAGVHLVDDEKMREIMKKRLFDVVGRLEMDAVEPDVKEVWDSCVGEGWPDRKEFLSALTVAGNGFTIRATNLNGVLVEFETPVLLPEDIGNPEGTRRLATYEDYCAAGEFVKENYADLLGMKEPVIDVECRGYSTSWDPKDLSVQKEFVLRIYDGGGSMEEQLLSHDLNSVIVCFDYKGRLSGFCLGCYDSCFFDSDGENGWDVSVISVEEAKEQLKAGNYANPSGYEMPGVDRIVKTELCYVPSIGNEYFLPYYCFTAEVVGLNALDEKMGMKNYFSYYVPAVSSSEFWELPCFFQ